MKMKRIGRVTHLLSAVASMALLAPPAANAEVLYEEDFEQVALNQIVTFPSEVAERNAWSDLATAQSNGALAGWQTQQLGVLGTLDVNNSGVREFFGWTFADKDWWIETSGDQDRSQWTRGYGVVGVADNDEFDDFSFGPAENQGLTNDRCDSVGTASLGSGGCFAATLTTPPISIAGQAEGAVQIVFDSSWRPEGEGPYPEVPDDPETPAIEFQPASPGTFQTGRLEVQFDDGPFLPLRTYRSDNTDGQRTLLTEHANPLDGSSSDVTSFAADLELVNEIVDVAANNPGGANTMRIRFNTYDAGNDWWWSVDNIQVYSGDAGPRDPALKVVVDRTSGDVSIENGTSKSVDLRGFEIASGSGSLDESAATFQADSDANWVQLTQPGSGTDLSEGSLTSAAIASGETITLGSAWLPYFSDETDISFQYLVSSQSDPITGLVEIVGGVNGQAFPFLDLNFDGLVDIDDWSEFLTITDTADLSDLTVAQAYRRGDLDGDLKLGVNDFITFQREFDRLHGVGALNAAISSLVPEPSSVMLLACIGLAAALNRSKRRLAILAIGLLAISAASTARAAVTVDRLYRLGDDPRENAVAGEEVSTNTPDSPFATGESIDSEGAVGVGQLVVNVKPNFDFGPTYVEITDRPDGGGGLGVQFDGANFENLLGQRLGTPSTTISSTFAGGALDYDFILDRGFQFWTKPLAVPDSMSGDPVDDVHIVMDTQNHGALINSNGRFAMKYNREDVEGVGDGAIAEAGQWYHVMVVRPDGPANGSQMYVNGVAVAAAAGDYLRGIPPSGTSADIPDTAPLIIGGATFPESDEFSQGFFNNYTGIVDDLEMFVTGFNASGDLGVFNVGTDNDYVAAFGPANPLDLNGDAVVDLVDVGAFVDNWQYSKVLNDIVVGDLETVSRGDFNYDGIVDLLDWELLNDASPSLAAAAMNMIGAVPEPSTCLLAVVAAIGLSRGARRRRR